MEQDKSVPDDKHCDAALGARWLKEAIGQRALVSRLNIVLNACRKCKEPLAHIFFHGPPGIGKTTFAKGLATELGTQLQETSGRALTKPDQLWPFLTNASEGSILLVEEFHRISPDVAKEFIPAMEEFRVNIVLGEGINARTIAVKLNPFTVIGTTTQTHLLDNRIRACFKMHEHLESYSNEELARIVTINAGKLQTNISPEAAFEIASRGPTTPRRAIFMLDLVRLYATKEADGFITLPIAEAALDILGPSILEAEADTSKKTRRRR